jgi:hypothetical protein
VPLIASDRIKISNHHETRLVLFSHRGRHDVFGEVNMVNLWPGRSFYNFYGRLLAGMASEGNNIASSTNVFSDNEQLVDLHL